MPIYFFERPDGKVVEQNHSIKNIPDEITCDDGVIAKRIFAGGGSGVLFKGPGDSWPSQQERRKKSMTKKNEKAGKKGYKDWKQRMPKLVKQ